ADVELAAKISAAGKFRNAGQVCISPTRFLVHRSLVEAFSQAFVRRAESLKLGDGLEEDTTLGPLANARRVTAITQVIEDARRRGAEILTGGERVGSVGNFFAPTVIAGLTTEADLFNNEPFGPVAGIRAFDRLDEAIAEANRLAYGLSAYAFTRSLRNAQQLMGRI